MSAASPTTPARHRPRSFTVFAAAFLAGAAAAVGVNRVVDVHVSQRKPLVECEPIFVALRSLPQGSPVTIWDVALKDWPKAMLPGSALRARDSFDGFVLRHALREGQPLLSVQLVRADAAGVMRSAVAGDSFVAPVPAAEAAAPPTSTQADPWMPSGPQATVAAQPSAPTTTIAAEAMRPTSTDIVADAVPVAAPQAGNATVEPTPVAAAVTTSEVSEPQVVATPTDAPADDMPNQSEIVAVTPDPPPAVAVVPTQPSAPTPPTLVDSVATATPTPLADDPEMTEAVATDVASMPSVMKPAGTVGGGPVGQAAPAAMRYLVVPERIALQADTSFTTPRPQPPGPPVVVQPVTPATPRPKQPAATTSRRGQQQPAGQQKQPQQRQNQPPTSQQRSWGGLFPNVAAGIDAMGGQWQRPRSGSTPPQTGSQPARR